MDSLRPYMKWTTPKMCIKKNLNSLFSMLIGSIFIGVIVIIDVVLGFARFAVSIPSLVIYFVFYVLGLILTGLVILLVKKTGSSRISRIQS